MKAPPSILERLEGRERAGNLRELSTRGGLVDFASNDYLGFSTTGLLRRKTEEVLSTLDSSAAGSTGSRLISGNSEFLETLERDIAVFHGAESALVFNSGYDANVGVFGSLPTRHDTIFYDERCHASIIDGIRLSFAKRKWSFRHNDLDDLRKRLRRAAGERYVAAESVYSMDGDFAPLDELASICRDEGAYLIVDEAHAGGIFGEQGRGRVSEMGLESDVFARVFTFGKALGAHGAAVTGPSDLRPFLINFARSFIYSTALDVPAQASIRAAYDLLRSGEVSPVNLFLLIHEFRQGASKLLGNRALLSFSPIQAVIVPSHDWVKLAARRLGEKGFFVKEITSPTVPLGSERIRICLHAFNAPPEVQGLVQALSEIS